MKKNEMKILELKNSTYEFFKNFTGLIYRRVEITEERLSESEDGSMENAQSEEDRDKALKNKNKKQSLGDLVW